MVLRLAAPIAGWLGYAKTPQFPYKKLLFSVMFIQKRPSFHLCISSAWHVVDTQHMFGIEETNECGREGGSRKFTVEGNDASH